MKRITLFAMLFALISVVAFAQNNQRENAQSQRSAFRCIDRHALAAWTKVGIQSVYYGGGECNKSAVDWIENPNASGISDIAADAEAGKYVIYNIAGQRMDAPRKGLNIINGRKVMVK